MAGSSNPSPGPKILLAKPGVVSTGAIAGKFGRGEDETAAHAPPHPLRSRLPSLNLLSDSWDFNIDRFLPFLSENTEFTVVGVIGPPGVGKSTIMNELYGFDATSPGMLPPFSILSEDTKALGKHCTSGIEPRISPQRLLLLDTQPVFSSSILAEMMRSDGSSTIPLLSGGESLSAELVLELLGIQLGVLLASICHILLVVSDGVHDNNMWRFMLTVDLLKHGIPDPSSLTSSNSSLGSEREKKSKAANEGEEYIATPVFVHTKLEDRNCTPRTYNQLSNALAQYLGASSFVRDNCRNVTKEPVESGSNGSNMNSTMAPRLFMVPSKSRDDCAIAQYESYISGLGKLRDQVLSMDCPSFARTVSERDWLKNSAKIWELIKGSPVITEYSRMLQSSGMFKK